MIFSTLIVGMSHSFKNDLNKTEYLENYTNKIIKLRSGTKELLELIEASDLKKEADKQKVIGKINLTRIALKNVDIWLRYIDPLAYKKINGPLPVEWETEVFEKFEKPYKREGAGLTLAALYLEETEIKKDSLENLIKMALASLNAYQSDSIVEQLKDYHHFYLCNRLHLLNLATIYTTAFECPDTKQIIPELRSMLSGVYQTYISFNQTFPQQAISQNYLELYAKAITYVNNQPSGYENFDHFTFIKHYINPLFAFNQELIIKYAVISKSNMDYSLNNNVRSIFSKRLYTGQNSKGIYLRVNEEKKLKQIDQIGKLLFYDPILSGNNLRSCASCHKPTNCFTDNTNASSLNYDRKQFLPRNSPSLINVQYNHLVMLDGKHISLQEQTKAVITNSMELACEEKELIKKILSCKDYKKAFKNFLQYTPLEKEITMEHISSAITMYYSKFSQYYSPFDIAMNESSAPDERVKRGFNIFMSKAQCATCHFAPQFNGVKPPFVGSEFEVLGTPADTNYKTLSKDKGRYTVNPAFETANAFRTGTIRNAEKTAPYMHNGVFKTLEQVIDFYDGGGGAGRGLKVANQTLSSDSLHLSKDEKKDLLEFIKSLNENISFEVPPLNMPESKIKTLNKRKVSGEY